MAAAAVLILVSYGALLAFVPVPGYGAPRFDPIGSWPAVIDRALFTPSHMFKWWPVDGKVVFDPDGALTVYPTCALILLGVALGTVWPRLRQPTLTCAAAGAALMALAMVLSPVCPIVKNIWTPTFVLLSGGLALVLFAALGLLERNPVVRAVLLPARVFGANALLAYLICFLFAPALDWNWIPSPEHGKLSLRWGSQLLLAGVTPSLSSLLFAIAYVTLLLPPLAWAYQRRWFLKL
jgi:predicted acyltransferase